MNRSLVVGAVLVLLAACSSDEATEVEFDEATTGSVTQMVAAPATIQPAARATVTAPVLGEVVEILVDDGERVEPGDAIVRLSSDELSAAVARARAGVEAAGSLAGISAPAPDLSPLLAAVRAQLEGVIPPVLDTAAAAAEQLPDEARAEALLRVTEARARYQQTARELRSAEQRAASSVRRATAAQRDAAAVQERQALAALRAAQSREEDLTLTAPIAGVVELASGDRNGEGAGALPDELSGFLGDGGGGPVALGARVAPGQPVFTVYDLSGFHVAATVDEVDAVLVDEGQGATVFVDAFPDVELRGHVRRVGIGPAAGAAGGVVYPVEIALTGVDRPFRVGMTASVEIAVVEVDDATVVPARALVRRDGRDVVFVARGDEVVPVSVDVLALGEDRAAVDGDVAPGDRVVTAGFDEVDASEPDDA